MGSGNMTRQIILEIVILSVVIVSLLAAGIHRHQYSETGDSNSSGMPCYQVEIVFITEEGGRVEWSPANELIYFDRKEEDRGNGAANRLRV